MTITEANAINIVVGHVLDDTSQDPDRLREACLHLAEKANKVLSAGVTRAEVESRWPE